MIKKVLMVLLGATLVLSMAGAVAAVEPTKSVTLNAVIGDGYTLNIPSEISGVTYEYAYAGNVSVSDIVIKENAVLKVTAASTSNWKLTNQSTSATIDYAMKYLTNQAANTQTYDAGTEVSTGTAEVLTFTMTKDSLTAGGKTSSYTNLAFKLTSKPSIAGTYTGSMSFTVSITDATEPAEPGA